MRSNTNFPHFSVIVAFTAAFLSLFSSAAFLEMMSCSCFDIPLQFTENYLLAVGCVLDFVDMRYYSSFFSLTKQRYRTFEIIFFCVQLRAYKNYIFLCFLTLFIVECLLIREPIVFKFFFVYENIKILGHSLHGFKTVVQLFLYKCFHVSKLAISSAFFI